MGRLRPLANQDKKIVVGMLSDRTNERRNE